MFCAEKEDSSAAHEPRSPASELLVLAPVPGPPSAVETTTTTPQRVRWSMPAAEIELSVPSDLIRQYISTRHKLMGSFVSRHLHPPLDSELARRSLFRS